MPVWRRVDGVYKREKLSGLGSTGSLDDGGDAGQRCRLSGARRYGEGKVVLGERYRVVVLVVVWWRFPG